LLLEEGSNVSNDIAHALHRIFPKNVSVVEGDASPTNTSVDPYVGKYVRRQFAKSHEGVVIVEDLDKLNTQQHDFIESAISQGKPFIMDDLSEINIQTSVVGVVSGGCDIVPSSERPLQQSIVDHFDLIIPCSERDRSDEVSFSLNTERLGGVGVNEEIENPVVEELAVERMQSLTDDELREYVAFARSEVDPTLSEEAISAAEAFYTTLISKVGKDAGHSVIPDGEESISRLVEASARMRLSDTAGLEDVRLVISLIYGICRQRGLDLSEDDFDAEIEVDGQGKVVL
jgi:replicative DNA helicase Mcm